MGGRVGLKGTDGMVAMARELGAKEIAPRKGKEALENLLRSLSTEKDMELEILTAGNPMGEDVVRDLLNGKVTMKIIHEPDPDTSSEDTVTFCNAARDLNAEFVLFTGGDGTARDVLAGVGEDIPILGVPSGVKMHSGVFTVRPEDAGSVVVNFLKGEAATETREVMDLDEDAYRSGEIRTKLFGYAKVPTSTMVQGCKNIVSAGDEEFDRRNIAEGVMDFMDGHPGIYIMGAGSTLMDIGIHLGEWAAENILKGGRGVGSDDDLWKDSRTGLDLTPLGFDVLKVIPLVEKEQEIKGGRGKSGVSISIVYKDANEAKIIEALEQVGRSDRYLVITPIGAQGFVLGRGTQVISELVLDLLPRENILVVATPGKLAITPTLRVDVGRCNGPLKGFIKVMTGYRRFMQKKIE